MAIVDETLRAVQGKDHSDEELVLTDRTGREREIEVSGGLAVEASRVLSGAGLPNEELHVPGHHLRGFADKSGTVRELTHDFPDHPGGVVVKVYPDRTK